MSTRELLHSLPGYPTLHLYPRGERSFLARKRVYRHHFLSTMRKWKRRQYFLTTAMRDVRRGALQNADILLGTSYIGLTIAFAAAVIGSNLTIGLFSTALALSDSAGVSALPLLVIAGSIGALCVAWVAAFIMNAVSISLLQGLRRNIHRSIIFTLRRALRYSPRVVATWVLYLALIAGPCGILGVSALALTMYGVISFDQLTLMIPYLLIAVLSWVIIISMNYTLAPIVALCEPQLSLLKVFGRSRRLVIGRGRIFVLAGLGALMTVVAMLYGIAVWLHALISWPMTPTLFFGGIIIAMFWTGILTALYRRRYFVER